MERQARLAEKNRETVDITERMADLGPTVKDALAYEEVTAFFASIVGKVRQCPLELLHLWGFN